MRWCWSTASNCWTGGVSGWRCSWTCRQSPSVRLAPAKSLALAWSTVALIQSLQRKGEVKDIVSEYGHIIVDECHHISAFIFEQVMKQVRARYIVGLTATPTRKDGHHPIIFMQCGPVALQSEPAIGS